MLQRVLLNKEIITGSELIPFLSQSDIYRIPTKTPLNAILILAAPSSIAGGRPIRMLIWLWYLPRLA